MLDCIVDIEQSAVDPLSNVVIKDEGRRFFVPVPQSIQQSIDLSNGGIFVNRRCQSWCPSIGSVGTLARMVSRFFAFEQSMLDSKTSRRARTGRVQQMPNLTTVHSCRYKASRPPKQQLVANRVHPEIHPRCQDYLPLSAFRASLVKRMLMRKPCIG